MIDRVVSNVRVTIFCSYEIFISASDLQRKYDVKKRRSTSFSRFLYGGKLQSKILEERPLHNNQKYTLIIVSAIYTSECKKSA